MHLRNFLTVLEVGSLKLRCQWGWVLLRVMRQNPFCAFFPEPTHWKRLWCWERLKAGREGDDRRQDGWMASLTQWARVRASSGRWWSTGKPAVPQSTGSLRVGHDWATEHQQQQMGAPWGQRSQLLYSAAYQSLAPRQHGWEWFSLTWTPVPGSKNSRCYPHLWRGQGNWLTLSHHKEWGAWASDPDSLFPSQGITHHTMLPWGFRRSGGGSFLPWPLPSASTSQNHCLALRKQRGPVPT